MMHWLASPCPKVLLSRVDIQLSTMGPLTIIMGTSGFVVVAIPLNQTPGLATSSTAAIRIGIYSGLHPAITAMTAIFS